jgi:hypothetical protein
MPEPDDIQLMSLVKKGDTEAFREIIKRHQASLLNLFRRLGADIYRAEDCTQETFIKLLAKIICWCRFFLDKHFTDVSPEFHYEIVELLFDEERRKMALAAPSIRIEAPVPGAPVVGIEVPNTVFGSVALRGAIESAAFQKIRARSKLAIALG